MSISPARTAAFDVLLRVETERSFTSVLLPIYEARLSDLDRGLCHELVLGTLRRQIYLDRVIEYFAAGKKLDAAVRVASRLGVYQLYFLDKVPTHSAVSESVDLVARARKASAKGFVNAILRRASAEKPQLSFTGDIDKLAVDTSHPRWMIKRWVDQFGFEDAANVALANNVVGRHAFRASGPVNVEDISGVRRSEFVDNCYVADRIDRRLIEMVERGEVYFQDEASQMVAAAVRVPEKGLLIDVCAAPGGKTGMIARRNSQIKIAAGDLHWQRVVLLRHNCWKQDAANVEVMQYDAEGDLPFADESFDTVLLDAPCSGTGTIRHNPEIRYFLQISDLADLSGKQLRILRNASKLLKKGGSLIYSTCSLERDENEDVIGRFLGENPKFLTSKPNVPAAFLTTEGFARTWPHRDNMDGFFIAQFRRR